MEGIAAAIIVVLVVLVLVAASALDGAPAWLRWFGRLPGDVRIRRDGFTLLVPIVSMLVVSIVLTVLLAILAPLLDLLSGAFGWFGRLPGDVRVRRDGFALFVPITSMVILSVLLTLAVRLVRWLGRAREGGDREEP